MQETQEPWVQSSGGGNGTPTPVFFPHSSVGKESACNAGDPSLIPGLGRPPGEGIGYPLQYSWASLVAQMVKNLPALHLEFKVGAIQMERKRQNT